MLAPNIAANIAPKIALIVAALIVAAALASCKNNPPRNHPENSGPTASTEQAQATPLPATLPAVAPTVETKVVMMLGDSLTAGLGLVAENTYPAVIQRKLDAAGYAFGVINAGVSGDTSAGGLARFDWLMRQRVDILLVALGGNDGLRGLSPQAMADNLSRIIEKAQARGIRVILAGLRMPTNYGAQYRGSFEQVFVRVARRYDVPLIPYLLKDVAGVSELNQADRIHPNSEGAEILAETVWQTLEPLLSDPD